MKDATKARFDRIDRALLLILSNLNFYQDLIMTTAQEFQDKLDALTAGQAEAKADSARHEASVTQAVGLLQALTAKIAELAAAGVQLITQAQLDALAAQADSAIADMTAANVQRDAADVTLDDGVASNTPAP